MAVVNNRAPPPDTWRLYKRVGDVPRMLALVCVSNYSYSPVARHPRMGLKTPGVAVQVEFERKV
jgi:hypothetical protein